MAKLAAENIPEKVIGYIGVVIFAHFLLISH